MRHTARFLSFCISLTLILASCSPQPQVDKGPSFSVVDNFEALQPIFTKNNDSTYIINFWATWCKPCVKELPYFEQLHEEVKGEKVQIILVSMDFPDDIDTKLKPFIEEHQLQNDVIAFTDGDYNSWIRKVEQSWDGAIPATIVYSASDRKFFSGELDSYEELANAVNTML